MVRVNDVEVPPNGILRMFRTTTYMVWIQQSPKEKAYKQIREYRIKKAKDFLRQSLAKAILEKHK
jgi:predicted lipase